MHARAIPSAPMLLLPLLGGCWSTFPRVSPRPHDAATTVAYTSAMTCHGPHAFHRGAGCQATHAIWSLRFGARTATLTVDDGAVHVFEGPLDPAKNAGIPAQLDERGGEAQIVWACRRISIKVHPRDAELRFRCDASADRAGGWTKGERVRWGISCEPGRQSSFWYDANLVFAQPPVEWVWLSCVEGDVGRFMGDGFRIAG
jgi:hypothetical protein